MDKKKIVFASVIGAVVLFIIGYSVFVLGGDDEGTNELQQTLVPELEEGEALYSSKKVAVDAIKEEKERMAPSIYDERFLDESGMYDEDLLDKKKQRMVDSIYSIGRIHYSEDSTSSNFRKPSRKRRRNKSEVLDTKDTVSALKAMGLEHQMFFAVSPQVLADGTGESLEVEIDGEQTIKVNDRLQMRVTDDTKVQGLKIKKNTLLYGIVKFRPNRVILQVNNIEGFPLKLLAYDNADGLEGIYIRNSFRGDVFNEVLGDVIEDFNIPGVPQVSGVKKVFQRNNRNVKVTVNNNYKLILKPKL
ncbi:conjugative transposon protein TraM [Ulvibacterium sp.]|uniref:conjugative transposon protein TraM n=1 Tax=Ulvibacterium sp. TaxID=2665914 RepID=UPI00262963CC|nr:conjugative transposon protein TraM [Ulvibacterium sp.]